MLKGTLDSFALPDIFRFISSCKKTGCIEVHRSAGEGRVFFRDGDVYHGESSLTRDPLGQKLVRAKLIGETDLRQALDVQAQEGGRLGDLLIASGKVTPEQIEAVVRGQIEDAVFDLLRWELGEFTFTPEVMQDAEVAISVSIENLIMEASRKLEELQVIATKIPSEHAVPAMAPIPPVDASEINITPDEWRILVLVTGTRSVADIAESAGLDDFSVMRTLYGLASTGLIEVVDGGRAEPVPMPEPQHTDLLDEEPVHDLPASELGIEEFTSEETTAGDEIATTELVSEELDVEFPSFENENDDVLGDANDAVADEPARIPLDDGLDEGSIVDRLAAVKELADLFQQTDAEDSRVGPPYPAEIEALKKHDLATQPTDSGEVEVDGLDDGRHRVEDDEEITRGLISRLIDGVKGL